MNKFKAIDLFAGIGGIRKGFENAFKNDIEFVFTSEIDKYALETYAANFGSENIYGDITDEEVMAKVPQHDILLAGFPCQPFSQAGLKGGFGDTRGTLFFYIEKILLDKKKRPLCFVLENVKHLRGHDKGNTFDTIVRHLDTAGYNVFNEVLRARDFGVPQNRERIFLVGFDKNNFPDIKFKFPEPLNIETRVGDILEDKVPDKYTISDRLWCGHKRRRREHRRKGNGFGYGLFNEDSEYTNTISARYYKDGSEILIEQQGKNPRKLTPNECSNLQGFKNCILPDQVSDTQFYRQFGNSVAVPVIEALAKAIKPHLSKKKKRQKTISNKRKSLALSA